MMGTWSAIVEADPDSMRSKSRLRIPESRTAPPGCYQVASRSWNSGAGVLEHDVGVFPVLNSDGVEAKKSFQGPGLWSPYTLLHVVDGGLGDSGELDHLHLGQHGLLTQRPQPISAVIVEHPSILPLIFKPGNDLCQCQIGFVWCLPVPLRICALPAPESAPPGRSRAVFFAGLAYI
jgi:hypothetical protein